MTVNSPRKKNAARTIKRIVTKKYTVGKYKNFKGLHYTGIKSGNYPTHASSLMRRMKVFPINVRVPIYRGMQNFSAAFSGRPKILNKLLANGKIENSFTSFSTNKKYAKRYSWKGLVMVLPPGRYPGINSSKFGFPNNREKEITLAPGYYILNKTKNINMNGNTPIVHVKYTPYNKFYAVNKNLL